MELLYKRDSAGCWSCAPLFLTVALVGRAGTAITTSLNKLSSQLCFPLILPFHLKVTLIKGCSAWILTVLDATLGCLMPSLLKAPLPARQSHREHPHSSLTNRTCCEPKPRIFSQTNLSSWYSAKPIYYCTLHRHSGFDTSVKVCVDDKGLFFPKER